MKLAILSDIHGNYDALRAVLGSLSLQGIQTYVCLGDIVGYGPEPAACLHTLIRYNAIIVAGNHDCAVTDKLPVTSFNALAKEAIHWTREQLGPDDLEFLAALPLVERVDGADFVHGALYTPELFDYVQTSYDAALSMSCMKNPVCFVGHSHVPITFLQQDYIRYTTQNEIPLSAGERILVNVGSVGQPRDKDPRACFAVYDTTEKVISIQRVRYDVDAVVAKLRAAGLPPALGERLRVGR